MVVVVVISNVVVSFFLLCLIIRPRFIAWSKRINPFLDSETRKEKGESEVRLLRVVSGTAVTRL